VSNELRMRAVIFLLADSQSRAAACHTSNQACSRQPAAARLRAPPACSPRARAAARHASGQPGAGGRALCNADGSADRVPGCGGGRGRPLLPARGQTVAGGVLQQHAGRQWGPGSFLDVANND
jgi:hypothetical protein